MASVATQALVPGVFGSREQAEAAIRALRQLGLADADLGIALPEPGRYLVPNTTPAAMVTGMETGVAIGAPLGTLAGIGIMSAIAAAAGPFGVGGLLVGAVGGTLWGTFFGTLGGLLAKVRWDDAEDRWCEIPLAGGDILLVARTHGHGEQVRQVMQQHGARCFLDTAEQVPPPAGDH